MSYSNVEKDFLLALLADKQRVDNRSFDTMRDLELSFGSEFGHVEVKLGKTRLLVQVSATVRQPRPERPFEGLFHIATDISSMASLQFENGRTSGPEEVLVSRMIEKAIRRSNALDLESLCIDAGKRCWMVRADVHYLDYDGGLIDATCIGVIAGLMHYRRPDTSIDGNNVIVHDSSERPLVPLSVLHIPISATWSFITLPKSAKERPDMTDSESDSDSDEGDDQLEQNKQTVALLDASAAEQALRSGQITITINKDREICQITKAGGAQISTQTLMKFTADAHSVSLNVSQKITSALEADSKRRNKGNLGAGALHDR